MTSFSDSFPKTWCETSRLQNCTCIWAAKFSRELGHFCLWQHVSKVLVQFFHLTAKDFESSLYDSPTCRLFFQKYLRSSCSFFRRWSKTKNKATVLQAPSLPLAVLLPLRVFGLEVLVHAQAVPAKHAEQYSREDPFVGMCAIQRKLNARLRSCRAWEFEDKILRCVSFFLVNRACWTKTWTCNNRSGNCWSICSWKRNSTCQYPYCHQIPGR